MSQNIEYKWSKISISIKGIKLEFSQFYIAQNAPLLLSMDLSMIPNGNGVNKMLPQNRNIEYWNTHPDNTSIKSAQINFFAWTTVWIKNKYIKDILYIGYRLIHRHTRARASDYCSSWTSHENHVEASGSKIFHSEFCCFKQNTTNIHSTSWLETKPLFWHL